MKKIGFKCSWDQSEPETQQVENELELMPPIIPGTSVAHLIELQMRIDDHAQYIASTAFTKIRKEERQQILEAYTFLVRTMMMIQPPQVAEPTGLTEFAGLDLGDLD